MQCQLVKEIKFLSNSNPYIEIRVGVYYYYSASGLQYEDGCLNFTDCHPFLAWMEQDFNDFQPLLASTRYAVSSIELFDNENPIEG